MIGKTNCLISSTNAEIEPTVIEFSDTPLTSFSITLDPYTYSASKVSITTKRCKRSLFLDLDRGHSIICNNVEYVNISSSTQKIGVLEYSESTITAYKCTPKPFEQLKPDIQAGLQTMIDKSNLKDAKIRIPCTADASSAYFNIWLIYATITNGVVEVTDIKFPYSLSSATNSFNYSVNTFSLTANMEIL